MTGNFSTDTVAVIESGNRLCDITLVVNEAGKPQSGKRAPSDWDRTRSVRRVQAYRGVC